MSVPKIRHSRRLQGIADERTIAGLRDKAEMFLSVNEYLPESEGGYQYPLEADEQLELTTHGLGLGMRLAAKAIETGQNIYVIYVNEAGGQSEMYFLGKSVQELSIKLRSCETIESRWTAAEQYRQTG